MALSTAIKDSYQVSVCIPVLNGEDYLREAVTSALEQDFDTLEIVIVDNCSADATPEIAHELMAMAPGRIRYFRNAENIGLAGNLERCVEVARGSYLKFLCVDDVLAPGCVAAMARILDDAPGVSLVCSARTFIDAAGWPLFVKGYAPRSRRVAASDAITRCLFAGNFIGEPSAVMFRRSQFPGGFRADLPQLVDLEMWFRLLEQGDLMFLHQPLCRIRVHGAQMTQSNVRAGRVVLDNAMLYDEYVGHRAVASTPLLALKHRLLMTYRLWNSRASLTRQDWRSVWDCHAVPIAYPLMPLVSGVVRLARQWVARRTVRLPHR